ncbi:XRE family transcriptional regulator [Streptomyces sp. Wb2n-11]|uniref:XRE family transcriptional regulator n=1 Tax=Streptomyces sp. Wb2n-11 TaxID=1030533 RepID=UPI000A91879B|nr:XRE family transcriptional regulator [Streptomyces sp. Wb2n-11]
MSDDEGSPDPYGIRNAGELIAALRALKDWSGLTYRELTVRAEAAGDVLPRSTVANMLARTTLPREELVAAYVRACGCGPGTVESWLKVRKELSTRPTRSLREPRPAPPAIPPPAAAAPRTATGSPAVALPGTGPGRAVGGSEGVEDAHGGDAGSGGARRRCPAVVVVPVVLALIAAAVAAGLYASGAGGADGRTGGAADGGAQGAPAAGERIVRVGKSSLCLTERAGSTGHLFQGPCESATPRFTPVPRGGATWRIATLHPEYGEGCMGVQGSARHAGASLENDYCGKRDGAETFRLDPVGSPVEGYRIRPLHTGLCLGAEEGPSDELWAEVVQTKCAADATTQIFRFDPPLSASAARNG